MIKTFVLDTNVLLHSAQSIEVFQDNDIVIPMTVVEELDKFKKNQDELGRNTRTVIRHLDQLREKGNLREGVPLSFISKVATGKLSVLSSSSFCDPTMKSKLDKVFCNDLGDDSPDNRILRLAFAVKERREKTIFISKDINLRLKADALGLEVMDFRREKIDNDRLYTGFELINKPAEFITQLYRDRAVDGAAYHLLSNQFAVFQAEGGKPSAITRLKPDNKLHILDPRSDKVWNVSPRNKEQRMALDLLLDPEVRLVTLVGGAGTGKTLLALAAALEAVITLDQYERMLVSRPIIPLGNDIGFLPGDKGSKLASWMQPIFDNLDYLLQTGATDGKTRSSSKITADNLVRSGKLELEALTYIRGRSIPRQFVIIDEAQNLTPHEIKTIVSRAGEDTKIVLTGDPHQIDNPYLDASSNGLSYAVERLKGHFIHGHVTLARSERSELSALAAKLL
jgi:PhoH-like ATPase